MDISHVDTCLSCYVLDWCNGDGELLIGVYVDRSTRLYTVRDALHSEISANDYDMAGFSYDEAHKAINSAFEGLNMLRCFDSSLDPADLADDYCETCQAWFRLSWRVPEPILFNVSYEIVTEESAIECDASERGFIGEGLTLREAIDSVLETRTSHVGEISGVECDEWPVTSPRWITIYNGQEFSTGAEESRSLHFPDHLTDASRLRIARLVKHRAVGDSKL